MCTFVCLSVPTWLLICKLYFITIILQGNAYLLTSECPFKFNEGYSFHTNVLMHNIMQQTMRLGVY